LRNKVSVQFYYWHNNSFSIEELKELHPLRNLKATDARLRRHKLH